MGHDVFISYSSHDKKVADAACALIEQRGYRCWIAPRDILPGHEWGEAIIDGIQGARVFILIFSGNANGSPQVRREVERAAGHNLPIVPFRIEAVQPARSLEYFISNQHWLDALSPPMERHLNYLADVVERLLADEAPASPRPGPSRPEPAAAAAQARSDRAVTAIVVALLVVIAAVVAYLLTRNPAQPVTEVNALAGNGAAPANELAEARPAPRAPPPVEQLLNFADVETYRDTYGVVAAASHLQLGAVRATVTAVAPAGAEVVFINGTSFPDAIFSDSMRNRNFLTVEMAYYRSEAWLALRRNDPEHTGVPSFGASSFVLQFEEPIRQLSFQVPKLEDWTTFPSFTVRAYDPQGRQVARDGRGKTMFPPGETFILATRSAAGISRVSFESGADGETIPALLISRIDIQRLALPADAPR